MSAPYSNDLRTKAINAVEQGEYKTDASRILNISRNILDLWLRRGSNSSGQPEAGIIPAFGPKTEVGGAALSVGKSDPQETALV